MCDVALGPREARRLQTALPQGHRHGGPQVAIGSDLEGPLHGRGVRGGPAVILGLKVSNQQMLGRVKGRVNTRTKIKMIRYHKR